MITDTKVTRLLRSSEVGALHRSRNPELRAALEALPEYAAALEHLRTIAAVEPPGVREYDYPDAGRRLAAAVKAGKAVPPPELIKELAAHDAEQRANQAIGHVIEAAQRLVVADLERAVDVRKLCAALTKRVCEVVDQARALKAVPASAEQAIAEDCVEEWRAVDGLAATYAAIREAQAMVWGAYSTLGTRLDGTVLARPSVPAVAAVLWIRNPQDVTDLDEQPQVGEVGFTGHLVWPTDFNAAASIWWYREHRDAQPWCPSPDQAEHAKQQLRAEQATDLTPEQRKARRENDQRVARDLHLAKRSAGRL